MNTDIKKQPVYIIDIICDLNIYCGNIYRLFCLDWKMKFVCGKNKKFRNSSFVSYAFNYKLGFKFEVIWDYHGISSSLF